MAQELDQILNELKSIKNYLIKLGPSRRSTQDISGKYKKAHELYDYFLCIVKNIKEGVTKEEIKSSDLKDLELTYGQINHIFLRIKELCSISTDCTVVECKNTSNNMEKFDLKTAISLLPVMTGDENVTKQLISNIEMYSGMIDESGKTSLITFILKSRLSESAKLRMCQNYTSISDLIKDMKSFLLPKKSDTAIQSQLQRAKQGGRTIEDFGKDIESMFVDLTISQADGDSQKYKILKTINEKNAIKRFSDGLRNSRISTIIAARNYVTLQDAIRGAMDEELSSQPEGTVMSYGHTRGRSSVYNNHNSRGYRQRYFNSYNRRPDTSSTALATVRGRGTVTNFSRHSTRTNNRGRSYSRRGNRSNTNTFNRGHRVQGRENHMNIIQSAEETPQENNCNNIKTDHFFRA